MPRGKRPIRENSAESEKGGGGRQISKENGVKQKEQKLEGICKQATPMLT